MAHDLSACTRAAVFSSSEETEAVIRSQKRRSDNNLRDHDMKWDFWTLSPESAHQVTWLMGDSGIPLTWRHLNGYGSHTYTWINAQGERFWVKYHFKTDQGIEFFARDEGDRMASADTDYHQRDLFAHQGRGVPQLDAARADHAVREAKTYRFNPFDLTKVWPHADYPLRPVGKLTLNRNVTDYHAEMEQVAFEPNNVVPPVNSPHVEVNSYSKDGRCGSRTSPTRCTRRTPMAARWRRRS